MKLVYTTFLLFLLFSVSYSQQGFDSIIFSIDGIDYQLILETKTWVEAAEVAYSNGGILAEINSQEEQDSIFYHLNNADINLFATRAPDGGNASYIWIGGNDLDSEGIWVWDGANDEIKTQFWEGAVDGVVVDSLYNNWGNEPDNFSNQDALGFALTNWPRGEAGQWNDVNHLNELFFLIEYDKSVLNIMSIEYDYEKESIEIKPNMFTSFDSVYIYTEEMLYEKKLNVSQTDSILSFNYPIDVSQLIKIRIIAFFDTLKAISKELPIEIYSFNNPINAYITDFEDLPVGHFIGTGFSIDKPFGFRDYAIHSQHDYESNSDLTFTLIYPIVVDEGNSIFTYSDVTIVEPGDSNSSFGNKNFNDYVVVEATKDLEQWIPLADGYDASLHNDWLNAWDNGALYRNLYKQHSIDIKDSYETGDTILIRFRLFSNELINGWGWTIDSLIIQDFPKSIGENFTISNKFILEQNYPNPFNPVTRISYTIAKAEHVTLLVYNNLGERIKTLIDSYKNAGKHEILFDGTNLASGVYFIRLSGKNQYDVKKISLIK